MTRQDEDKLSLEIMRLGVDYKFPVKIGEVTVMLRPLSSSEMVEAYSAVAEHMETLPKAYRNEVAENMTRAKEFLKRASSPFDEYVPQLSDFHLNKMTNDQLMAVYREWISITDRVNPQMEKIDPAAMMELVENIKKNGPEDLVSELTELSTSRLVSLVHYLLTKSD